MAEPIVLPLLSSQKHVKLPPEPTTPPGPRDITNALRLTTDLVNARRRDDSEVTDDDVYNGALYQHKLITVASAHEGDAPPWFFQALQKALDPIDRKIDKLTSDMQTVKKDVIVLKKDVNDLKNDMQTVKKDVKDLKDDVKELKNDLKDLKNDVNDLKDDSRSMKKTQEQIRRISAILYNQSQGSGNDTALEVVPYENGEDPTKPPHNLPPLSSVKTVTGLTPTQRDAYHKGYCGNQRITAAQRTEGIFTAIGANRY